MRALAILAGSLAGLFGCATSGYDKAHDCHRFQVDGNTQAIVVYRKGGEWFFAEPSIIEPDKIVNVEAGADVVLAAFDDGSKVQSWNASGFYVHGDRPRFCLVRK